MAGRGVLMPFLINGKCLATAAEANLAFMSNFPQLGDTNYTSWVSSSVSNAGVLNYSVSTRSISGNPVSSRSGTMQLASCPTPDPLPTQFDTLAAGALWAFFFCFVMVLYLVARSAGSILTAIRRF